MGANTGTYTVELIHEESASKFDDKIDVPAWVLGRNVEPTAFLNQYLEFAESPNGIGLIPWKDRTDMPSWAKQISLCLTLHGMHWSGYIFNTYDQMLEIIRYAAERTDGKNILAIYQVGKVGITGNTGIIVRIRSLVGRKDSSVYARNHESWGSISCRCSGPTA